jgi:hypothetical protein
MAKKSILIATAITVLAFAIPNTASATKLTDPVNTLLVASPTKPVTIVVTSTNLELTRFAFFGTVPCKKWTMSATLTENTGTRVHASEDTTAANMATECTAGETKVTIKNIKLATLLSTSTTAGGMSLTFEIERGALLCKFTAKEIPGTFASGTDEFSVNGPLETTAGCKGGTPELHGTFTIETPGGTPIIIDD